MRRHSLFEAMARIGYAARGIVFLVLGAFLLLSALKSQRAVGSTDALRSTCGEPHSTSTRSFARCSPAACRTPSGGRRCGARYRSARPAATWFERRKSSVR